MGANRRWPVLACQAAGILALAAVAGTACASSAGHSSGTSPAPAASASPVSSPSGSSSPSPAASAPAGSPSGSSPAPSPVTSARPASSSGQQSRVVTVASAIRNPCLLVTLSQARAILGPGADSQTPGNSASQLGSCAYAAPGTKPDVVDLNIATGTLAQALYVITSPAPAAGLGHHAECGASGLAGPFALVAVIDSGHQLLIFSPSCATAVKFAKVAYSKLG